MRLTDWCILFFAVCLCVFLPLDLRAGYLAQAFCQQKVYDRILDRVCEDSLIDGVVREEDDGSVQVDADKLYARFEELLMLEFGSVSEEERRRLLESVRMRKFENLAMALTAEETDQVRRELEKAVLGDKDRMADSRTFALFFPYVEQEDWYQTVAGPSLYSLFDADDSGKSWDTYHRYVFSGGRIVKRALEAEPAAAQSGSY